MAAVVFPIGAVVLVVIAVLVKPTEPGGKLDAVDDPESITLPRLGLFGGETALYGVADRPGVPASDLGCRLLSADGDELSSAKLSDLRVLLGRRGSSELGGTTVEPLFIISSYPSGAVLACTDADAFAPLALAEPSTFGDNAGLVRATAIGAAVTCALMAVLAWVLLLGMRRRP